MRHLLFFILLFGLCAAPVFAQNGDTAAFMVTDVPVDVTADSAAHARDQAVAQAQRDAFSQLLSQMNADPAIAAKLSDNDIATLTQNFEVQSERTSSVRYIGVFTVQFRPNAVRNFLNKKGARYSENRAKPVIVLPVYAGSGQPVLWENHNAWRVAWETAPRGGSIVPMTVPGGTPDDMTTISTAEALSGKPDAIRALIAHYQGGSLAVVTLTGSLDILNGSDYKVTVQRYTVDGVPLTTDTLTIPAVADKNALTAALAQGVKDVRGQIDKDYKEEAKTLPPDDSGINSMGPVSNGALLSLARLTATVPISTLPEWAQLQRKLAATPGMAAVDVITLERGAAVIEIHFSSSLPELQKALQMENIELAQDAPTGAWVLRGL